MKSETNIKYVFSNTAARGVGSNVRVVAHRGSL